jgi:hypothetical protein
MTASSSLRRYADETTGFVVIDWMPVRFMCSISCALSASVEGIWQVSQTAQSGGSHADRQGRASSMRHCHVGVLTDLGRLCQRHLVHLRSLSVKMLNRLPVFTLSVPPHPLHSVLGVNRGIRSLGCFIRPLDQYSLWRRLSVHQSE